MCSSHSSAARSVALAVAEVESRSTEVFRFSLVLNCLMNARARTHAIHIAPNPLKALNLNVELCEIYYVNIEHLMIQTDTIRYDTNILNDNLCDSNFKEKYREISFSRESNANRSK